MWGKLTVPNLFWNGKTTKLDFPKINWHPWVSSATANRLLWGENGAILQDLASEFEGKIKLIYLDPPFCSDANYHQKIDIDGLIHEQLAYSDNWNVDDYLQFMYSRLLLLKPLLHSTGSIFLHCDPHQSHHLRALLDEIFGEKQFRNEIIWHYTGGGRTKKYFSRKHDTIFWYSKSDKWIFNIDAVRVPYAETSGYAKTGIRSKTGKVYLPHPKGKPVDDTWDIPIINPMSAERNGYPTQKPRRLLDRIILGCSNPNDLVLDPFIGSGTSAESALINQRRFIGIDANINSVHCTIQRLFQKNIKDFSIISSQKIFNRKAGIRLEKIPDLLYHNWNIAQIDIEDEQDSVVQYILLETVENELQITNNRPLPLSKLKNLTLVFLNGSQSHFQIPNELSDSLVLYSKASSEE